MNSSVIRDIVAVVPQRRRAERKQPDTADAQIPKILKLLGKSAKVSDAIGITVEIRFDMKFVKNRILVPKRIIVQRKIFVDTYRHEQSPLEIIVEIYCPSADLTFYRKAAAIDLKTDFFLDDYSRSSIRCHNRTDPPHRADGISSPQAYSSGQPADSPFLEE